MARGRLRYSLIVLAAGLLVAGVPAVASAAGGSKGPAVGDRCLIGTWRDNGGVTSTRWLGHTVRMKGGARDFDHIHASGIDRDSWGSSKPLVGRLKGHRLTETVRGQNRLQLRAGDGSVVMTELGWKAHSTNRYLYRGKHSTGYLNQTGTLTDHFRCTLTTLTLLGKAGKVRSTETRVSFKP